MSDKIYTEAVFNNMASAIYSFPLEQRQSIFNSITEYKLNVRTGKGRGSCTGCLTYRYIRSKKIAIKDSPVITFHPNAIKKRVGGILDGQMILSFEQALDLTAKHEVTHFYDMVFRGRSDHSKHFHKLHEQLWRNG